MLSSSSSSGSGSNLFLTAATTGCCNCGKIQFKVQNGAQVLFNELCHCKACSRAVACSPVHLIGVPRASFELLQGEPKVVVSMGRTMRFAFCRDCGSAIYQHPAAAAEDFVALHPTSFCIQQGDSCLLPPHLLPRVHANYENRQYNHYDALPKYQVHAFSSALVDNEGRPLTTSTS